MGMGRPLADLLLTDSERETLTRWSRRRQTSQALALRCRIVLHCAERLSNQAVAAKLKVCGATVGTWRRRFVEHRLDGLSDEPRPGVPRTITDEQGGRGRDPLARNEAEERDSLEHPRYGGSDRVVAVGGGPHLEGIRPAAASNGNLQTVDRSAVPRQGPRHCGSVPRSAWPGDCAVS